MSAMNVRSQAESGAQGGFRDPPSPGWYPDRHNLSQLRYWDGETWTDRVWSDIAAAASPAPSLEDPARERVDEWYPLRCMLPFGLSLVVPWMFMALLSHTDWVSYWIFVATGWLPWLAGAVGTVVGASRFGELRTAHAAGARPWHAVAITLMIVLAGWGLLCSVSLAALWTSSL
jgi:hypothetical protein